MTRAIRNARSLVYENALWLVGLGLMLASSGIDGAYMARWMPAAWLGYILNTTADLAGMALTYYYGQLVRTNARSSKKHKLARALLAAEAVAVFYSWFFSWRQLILVLPVVEGIATAWVAPLSAAFIPLLLAAIGLAQSLILEPADTSSAVTDNTQALQVIADYVSEASMTELKPISKAQFLQMAVTANGDGPRDWSDIPAWLQARGYESKSESTARRWWAALEEESR